MGLCCLTIFSLFSSQHLFFFCIYWAKEHTFVIVGMTLLSDTTNEYCIILKKENMQILLYFKSQLSQVLFC